MTLMTNSFRKRVPFPIKRKKFRLTDQTRNLVAENPGSLFRTRLGACNVSFKFLYRDASNYKLHGEAVFTNHTFMPIDEIEKQIRSCLKDGEFFIARQVNIEERFFDVLHEDDDHPWHEFNLVEMTTEPAFDPENWNQHKHKRDITEFVAELEKAKRVGWDELKVRADVTGMQEKQKDKLKQTLESGEDILK
jgi:hypothetical protein